MITVPRKEIVPAYGPHSYPHVGQRLAAPLPARWAGSPATIYGQPIVLPVSDGEMAPLDEMPTIENNEKLNARV